MTFKIEQWSQQDASRELTKRLDAAKKYRASFEDEWRINEDMLFDTDVRSVGANVDDITGLQLGGGGESGSELKLNYAIAYIRFIHSQMSANPPSAIPKPTSEDLKDRRSADVADDLIQHAQRNLDVQDTYDLVSLDSQVYGTGWMRCWFNPHLGDIYDTNEDTAQVLLEGDNEIKRLSPWAVWHDANATNWKDNRFVFIEHEMDLEQAISLWPQHKEALEAREDKGGKNFFNSSVDDSTPRKTEVIKVYEYIEKRLPWNGNKGRYVWMLDDGLLLTALSSNPFPNASIPVNLLTDIDVPGQILGKAVASYLARAQELLEAIDSTILDNVQAHAVIRLVLPDGAEIQDEGVSNLGWEYIKTSGNAGNAPFFMSSPGLMPDIYTLRAQILEAMEKIAGVNESMLGKQSREMSGFSMQTAINAGNMVRRRLFNKATALVKWMWITYLVDVAEHWTDGRKVLVVGEEGALSVAYYSSADISGGFDIQVDYGQSFSLDPASRREEIMQLAPMLKEAGMTANDILAKIKLNDVKGLYSMSTLAKRRQEEIFEEMIAKNDAGATIYIAPREIQEHKGMLDAAYKYVMTKRFDNQPEEVKKLIERHIVEREAMGAKAQAAAEPAAPAGMPAAMPPLPQM